MFLGPGFEFNFKYNHIILDQPIKKCGVTAVEICPHPEASQTILVVVAKTEAEAAENLAEYKKAGSKVEDAEEESENLAPTA